MSASRRDFLKMCGCGVAAAAISSCKSKISKAIPYIIAPVEITPGEAIYYASSYINGNDYCSIIVKSRDGRPIKIEGNPGSGITRGGTSARVQASVLDLYDKSRYQGPLKNNSSITWEAVDAEIPLRLQSIGKKGGSIVLLTPTIFSPSTEAVISGFLTNFPGSEWIQYDAISCSALVEANMISFGRQMIPDYRFDRADLIVSLGADFLGTWLSPVEYTKQFSSRRDPAKEMNYLVVIESGLSLTGCNADERIQIKPTQEYNLLLNIYKEILIISEKRGTEVPRSPVDVAGLAVKLVSSRGKSIVVSGSNSKDIQLLVNEINRYLGNIGSTILFDSYLKTRGSDDRQMVSLVKRMNGGDIDALLTWNVNPVYTWYDANAISDGLKKVELTVSLSGFPDETSDLSQFVCPDNHYLESWNDAEPKKDYYSLMQPVINPIFNTRQMCDTLLKWSGSNENYYDYMRSHWARFMLPRQKEYSDPVSFFDNTLQKGIFEPVQQPGLQGQSHNISGELKFRSPAGSAETNEKSSGFEIVLYEPVAMGEGRQSNNPWLQELPDPVSRICWDNYAAMSVKQAVELGISEGDIIETEGVSIPVHIQPGQAYGTLSIALGYGRIRCGKVGQGVGINSWQLIRMQDDHLLYNRADANITRTGLKKNIAQVQTHHTMEGRALVRKATLDEFRNKPSSGNELHAYYAGEARNLYKERYYPHHHWGMVIDLSRCTGCGNCVIACQSENNIPVVGKEEVNRVHEMHWLRIDRYYTGNENDGEVVFQPVLCQHCQNAPCENVCPVAATNHSSEGLNQMIYNRCFGTRYCNNNCPYKVRRFNWFNYTESGTLGGNLRDKTGMTEDLRRMVLNPDVTVRSQGVIEKCSFCIQRIQAAKLKAKTENRALLPEEIKTACSQSCPADAIIFGDFNDRTCRLSNLVKTDRCYNLLEELYTRPSVNYLTKISRRNKI